MRTYNLDIDFRTRNKNYIHPYFQYISRLWLPEGGDAHVDGDDAGNDRGDGHDKRNHNGEAQEALHLDAEGRLLTEESRILALGGLVPIDELQLHEREQEKWMGNLYYTLIKVTTGMMKLTG